MCRIMRIIFKKLRIICRKYIQESKNRHNILRPTCTVAELPVESRHSQRMRFGTERARVEEGLEELRCAWSISVNYA